MSEDKWIHDDCGGEVDTNKIYWTCKKCHSFVWVCDCNGNSKVTPISIVDELQRKLNIAVEALKDIIDFYVNGNSDYRYAEHQAMEALKKLEEK